MTRRQFFLGWILQAKSVPLQIQVIEVFSTPGGPSAFLVHHASNATRTVLAEWLRRNSGAAVVCRLSNGTEIHGRIFRVGMCFGRGLILTTEAVPIRAKDVLIIEPI